VPFTADLTANIPPSQIIKEYWRELVREEGEGIINWMIEGWKKYQAQGLVDCPAVVQASLNYRAEMDVFAGFLRDACTTDDLEVKSKPADLYIRYRVWYSDNGHYAMSATKFSPELVERGFGKVKIGGEFVFKGIAIKPNDGFVPQGLSKCLSNKLDQALAN
jgi:putative DNA primase/helicase